jgi:hypothetical protein
MNRKKPSSPTEVLEQVLAASNDRRQIVRITNLSDLMRYATVTYSVPEPFVLETDEDCFHYAMLRELYREVRFYFRQTKLGNPNAADRLKRALKGLTGTALQSNPACVQRFISEIARDEATEQSFLHNLMDTPDVHSFIASLQNFINEAFTNTQTEKPIS